MVVWNVLFEFCLKMFCRIGWNLKMGAGLRCWYLYSFQFIGCTKGLKDGEEEISNDSGSLCSVWGDRERSKCCRSSGTLYYPQRDRCYKNYGFWTGKLWSGKLFIIYHYLYVLFTCQVVVSKRLLNMEGSPFVYRVYGSSWFSSNTCWFN